MRATQCDVGDGDGPMSAVHLDPRRYVDFMNITHVTRNILRALAVLPFVAVACAPGGPVEDIKNCVQICDNYQDCQDADFDRTQCAEACEGRADFDDDFKAAADACENCLDEGSCAEQANRCAADCDPIINQSS